MLQTRLSYTKAGKQLLATAIALDAQGSSSGAVSMVRVENDILCAIACSVFADKYGYAIGLHHSEQLGIDPQLYTLAALMREQEAEYVLLAQVERLANTGLLAVH